MKRERKPARKGEDVRVRVGGWGKGKAESDKSLRNNSKYCSVTVLLGCCVGSGKDFEVIGCALSKTMSQFQHRENKCNMTERGLHCVGSMRKYS